MADAPRPLLVKAADRPVVPWALLLLGVLSLLVAIAPDAAFAAVLSQVLHRASKADTLADWHRLQHAALLVAAVTGVIGAAGLAQWRRIEPAFDRLGRALQFAERDWLFDCIAVLVVLAAVHGTSLVYGELRTDDYQFLREGRVPLAETILRIWGGHVFPLWRVENAALHNLWGPHAWAFRLWLFVNVALLAFLQARLLAAWGLSRSARLVGIVILCGWTQWAQVTMGYWTLSISVKVWIATSIAVLAIVGGERPGAVRKAIILLAGLIAILEDSSGAIVVPALILAAVASGWRSGLSIRDIVRRSAWPAAVAVICALIFFLGQALVHLEARTSMGELGGGSFIGEALYLLGFGTAGALVAPVVTTILPPRILDGLSILLSFAAVTTVWFAWRRGSKNERAPLAYNAALLSCGLVMVVGARPYANHYFMTGWTHYISFLYVPTAAALAVIWQEARRICAWRPALEVQLLVVGCALFLGAQEACGAIAGRLFIHGGRHWEKQEALDRRAMIDLLRDSLFTPIQAVVPPGGRVPEMLSTALDARFPNLQPLLPLSFYDQAAGVPQGRFRWVVGPYMNGVESDTINAAPVTEMKRIVDPAFQLALRHASWWRDTYFATTPLEPASAMPVACESLRRGASPLTGDADRRHWLLIDATAAGAAGITTDTTFVDLVARTTFRARAVYRLAINSAASGCLRLELLNLPEFVLSDTVELLALEQSSKRRIELLGLFPPAVRQRR